MFGSMSFTLSELYDRDEIVFEWFDSPDDLDDAATLYLNEAFRNNGRLVNVAQVA